MFCVFEYKMEKLQMCRMCFVKDARMFKVVNQSLHEIYEKLTAKPFVTEDRRPVLVCYFCCTKLKQCCLFQRKCLEAEERYAQMLDEDYEPNPLLNPEVLEFNNGFIKAPMELISIEGECPTESLAIKEEEPADCERLADIIELKEEPEIDELEAELDNPDSSDVEVIPVHHSDSEDNVSITEFKTEVEEEQATSWAPVAKKPKQLIRRTKLKDLVIEEEKKNEQSDSTVICTTQYGTSQQFPKFKEPLIYTKLTVNRSLNNTNIDNKNCINSDKNDIRCKISNNDSDIDEVTRYQRLCVKEKPYNCEVCQYSCNQERNLTRHINRCHTEEKPFECDKCQRSFSEKNDLKKHYCIHSNETPYKCELCQRGFKQKNNFTRHIRNIHRQDKSLATRAKSYKCDVCQYSCNEKAVLTKHIRIHTGDKPFKCEVCQYRCHEKCDLTKHILRRHTEEKPFECDICQRRFYIKCDLNRHLRAHTSEKPYKCNVCQYSCSQKGTLKLHILKHHTGEKP